LSQLVAIEMLTACGTGILSDEDNNTLPTIHPIQQVHAHLIPGIFLQAAKFPLSFYAVDIHHSFSFKWQGNLTLEMQFQDFFNIPFKSSTYYDHKVWWLQAPRDARDRALAAGYEQDGMYSKFMAAYPAKDAKLKAVKQKMRAAAKSSS
jgi:hypothetical protein